MKKTFLISLAQINPLVGDLDGNVRLICEARAKAAEQGADLVVFGEMVLSGYPLGDLVLKPSFVERVMEKIAEIAVLTEDGGPAVLLGAPWYAGGNLYNAAVMLDEGDVSAVRFKRVLQTSSPFHEERFFSVGARPSPLLFRGFQLGIMIGDDLWSDEVTDHLASCGSDILIALNSSPFEAGKQQRRLSIARSRVSKTGLPLVYVNLLGGQDEVVFDGTSFVLDSQGDIKLLYPAWKSFVEGTHWWQGESRLNCESESLYKLPSAEENLWSAMVMGLSDYVKKSDCHGVVMGISGGIDSAVSAAIAVDALGAENVVGMMLRSPWTSSESLKGARLLRDSLGITLHELSIESVMSVFQGELSPVLGGDISGIAAENIQARIRAVMLMSYSNTYGHLLLMTGNKSEAAVGYATIYGDMCGGYSVLGDLYKTMVFQLARWRNRICPSNVLGSSGVVIPQLIIDRAPSAELRADQKDEDNLPPYDLLDKILYGLVEEDLSVGDLISHGYSVDMVKDIWCRLHNAEYKRRQMPLCVKLSKKMFHYDRKYPIVNGFTRLVNEEPYLV